MMYIIFATIRIWIIKVYKLLKSQKLNKEKLAMTKEQLVENYLDMLREFTHQGYSQDLAEIAGNMLLVIPVEQMIETTTIFTEIAKKGLPETKYHLEISKIFADIMGYQMPK